MFTVNQAESLILDLIQPLDGNQDIETVRLEEACDRILAQPVTSNLDFPHWDNSAMDGYAVRFEDVATAKPEQPVILDIIEEIAAGYQPKQTVRSGQASRIFTGAMLPSGADTVIMQEETDRKGDQVIILKAPRPQDCVRKQGEYYRAGETLLNPGIRLNPAAIAVLAAAQCSQLQVYRRPRVAIFTTGDELVSPSQPLKPGQIVDSNQYALTAFVRGQGAIALPLGIVPDQPDQLRSTIQQAICQADIVLSTGGVSVGDYDYIDGLLEELGAKIAIRSVAIKPGKPLTVAKFNDNCLYFGIPGNPVSALVSCWRFVQPALHKLSGLQGNFQPIWIKAITRDRLQSGGKRETYLWGNLELIDGEYQFNLAGGSQSSGNLINLAQTNALAMLAVGQREITVGESVMVIKVA